MCRTLLLPPPNNSLWKLALQPANYCTLLQPDALSVGAVLPPQPFPPSVSKDCAPSIKVQLNTNKLRSESLQKDNTSQKIRQPHHKSTEENGYLEHKERNKVQSMTPLVF